MKNIFVLLSLALVLAWLPTGAQAQGISERLNQSLDAMVNHTPPGVHETNRRTVVTGGSLAVKLETGRVDAFGFRAPSVSVGCGGIDAFFGAFSMISKEVLVQALRAIVTGALQYAFRIALKVLCQSCEQIMGTIADGLQKANQYLGDMCNVTNNFLESRWPSGDVASKLRGESVGTSIGVTDDRADAGKWGSTNNIIRDIFSYAPDRAESALPEYGNHLYNAVKKAESNVFYWLGTNSSFHEEMMSLIGANVVCAPEVGDDCPPPQEGPNVTSTRQGGEIHANRYAPVLTFEFLVTGDSGVVDDGAADISAAIWKCNDTGGRFPCLAPSAGTMEGYLSVHERMRRAFLGDGDSSGILYKMRYNYTDALTLEEGRWLQGGGNMVGMVMDLATKDYNAALGWVNDYGELIAADYTFALINDAMIKIRQAMAEQPSNNLREQQEMIDEAFLRVRDDYMKIQARAQGKSAAYDAYLARAASLSGRYSSR